MVQEGNVLLLEFWEVKVKWDNKTLKVREAWD
jgi:hypothetical protein